MNLVDPQALAEKEQKLIAELNGLKSGRRQITPLRILSPLEHYLLFVGPGLRNLALTEEEIAHLFSGTVGKSRISQIALMGKRQLKRMLQPRTTEPSS